MCDRLSNHLPPRASELAPTALPLPSTSTSTSTKACDDAVTTTEPKRNGRENSTWRSKKAISRTARRGGIAKPQSSELLVEGCKLTRWINTVQRVLPGKICHKRRGFGAPGGHRTTGLMSGGMMCG